VALDSSGGRESEFNYFYVLQQKCRHLSLIIKEKSKQGKLDFFMLQQWVSGILTVKICTVLLMNIRIFSLNQQSATCSPHVTFATFICGPSCDLASSQCKKSRNFLLLRRTLIYNLSITGKQLQNKIF
jgi:hypothetical protein